VPRIMIAFLSRVHFFFRLAEESKGYNENEFININRSASRYLRTILAAHDAIGVCAYKTLGLDEK
jgi:hypothetical protein